MQAVPSTFLRQLALVLCLSLFGNSIGFAAEKHKNPPTIQEQLQQHGVGKQVRIVRTDGTQLKGSITTLNPADFQLAPKKGAPVTVAYTDIKEVHGPGLSTGAKVGISVLCVIGVVVIAGVIYWKTHPLIGKISISGPIS